MNCSAPCNLVWRSFLTLSTLLLSFICLCHTACTHASSVVFALQPAFLFCLVLPYCCVCVFPATIRLRPPQALAALPTPYGKANEAGSAPQDSRSVSAVHVPFKGSDKALTRGYYCISKIHIQAHIIRAQQGNRAISRTDHGVLPG